MKRHLGHSGWGEALHGKELSLTTTLVQSGPRLSNQGDESVVTQDVTMTAKVPQPLLDRLASLAERTGRTTDECLVQAIGEFCDTWEDYHRTVDQLLREDAHRYLRVVNN